MVPFLAALRGACCTRVPNRDFEPATETHVPVVKMFCIVSLAGGHSSCRRWGSSCCRGCCSIRRPVSSLAFTWLTTSSSPAWCPSSTSVSASATSSGWDVCLCRLICRSWLIRRGGRRGYRCVRRLGRGCWGSWCLPWGLLICRGICRRPSRELLRLHLWARLRHQCHLLLRCDHRLPGCRHFCPKCCHLRARCFGVCIVCQVNIGDRFVDLVDTVISFERVCSTVIRVARVESSRL